MQIKWDDNQAASSGGLVGECVYGSRLLGADPTLALAGGGNTSIKTDFDDITGRNIDAIFIKGSGSELATIEAAGFSPLRLDRLRELLELDSISDPDMMRELALARLDPDSPQPSVEALLHAFIPHPAVMHSHSVAMLALTNSPAGQAELENLFGPSVLQLDYQMPGFGLARQVKAAWEASATDHTIGILLKGHGLFTFGSSTREAYQRHMDLVQRATDWLDANAPVSTDFSQINSRPTDPIALTTVRRDLSEAAGKPMIVSRQTDPASTRFSLRSDLADLATRGCLTPDHALRTKHIPLVGTDVAAFAEAYRAYFNQNAAKAARPLTMVDPAPRVIVDPSFGILAAGSTATEAQVSADIYANTIETLERCEDSLGGYQALDPSHMFELEYWNLQQAKLDLAGPRAELAGTIALVTGAASGIGKACAAEMLDRGCAVVGLDISESVATTFDGPNWLGLQVDVSAPGAQATAIKTTIETFGGLDILIVAAGVFGPSTPIAEMGSDGWRFVQSINVDSVLDLFTLSHPYLALSPIGGRVAIIGSKNVAAPGMGAAAYSSSKAALTQLGRVAALEWASDGIRINNVHPDAVFDTALWTPELLAERASKYGLSIEDYKKRNLLSTEVTSAKVAHIVGELCSDGFSATTGAHIPIDGGSDRVI